MHVHTAVGACCLMYLDASDLLRKHLLTQLQVLELDANHLVGTLPETWSSLTHVSPRIRLTC